MRTSLKGDIFFPHERAGAGVASPSLCQKKCQAYERCQSWTFSYDKGCQMFVAPIEQLLPEADTNNIYATSGPPYCTAEPSFVGGCLEEACAYEDESTTTRLLDNISSPWRCQTTCQLARTCVGFSYDYEEVLCSLKGAMLANEKKTAKDGTPRHKICGPKTCDLWNKSAMQNIIYRDTPMEDFIKGMLAKMTLEQKVGQMILTPDAFYSPEAQLEDYQVNVLWGPGYKLKDPVEDLQKHFDAIYYFSNSDSDGSRVAIPSLIAVDAVHGLGMAKGATMFPHNIGLGCANDTRLMAELGRVTAVEMTAMGADWTLAPMTAVTMDVRWGRTYESFSMDGHTVANMAEAFLKGLQGDPTKSDEYLKGTNVPGMCKHFLADGAPLGGFTDGDADLPEDELIEIHAVPFESCFRAGMITTMPSFNDVNGWEMHQNGYLLTDVLKTQFGFDGVVLSDWNAHQQIMGCPWSADDCPIAINAGVDMFLVAVGGGSHWTSFVKKTVDRVLVTKDVSQERIDDAVSRILRMKARMGLIGPQPTRKSPVNRPGADKLKETLGNPEHMAIAREAVRKSAVLLKNKNAVLPLKPNSNILLTGKADSAHLQHGAWSLDWQGQDDDQYLGYASTLKEAMEEYVQQNGGSLTFIKDDGQSTEMLKEGKAADAIVHVMAEHPYAEVEGDLIEASLMHSRSKARTNNFGRQFVYASDMEILLQARNSYPDTPIIVILYSGRPLYVNKELNIADAFVSAWLPGSMAGEGLVDLLFAREVASPTSSSGPSRSDFTARLAFQWPLHPCQTYNQIGDGQEGLFQFGEGLSYATGEKVVARSSGGGAGGEGRLVSYPLPEVAMDRCMKTYCWGLWDCGTGQYVETNNMPNWIPQTTD